MLTPFSHYLCKCVKPLNSQDEGETCRRWLWGSLKTKKSLLNVCCSVCFITDLCTACSKLAQGSSACRSLNDSIILKFAFRSIAGTSGARVESHLISPNPGLRQSCCLRLIVLGNSGETSNVQKMPHLEHCK